MEEVNTEEIKKTSLIDNAVAAAERLEKANAELKLLLQKQEELAAKQLLGGRSEAGVRPQQDPVVEEKKMLNELFKGTGINIR